MEAGKHYDDWGVLVNGVHVKYLERQSSGLQGKMGEH
jgi:hypothetical protein